ncbi:MAG: hypothetical protein AB1545_11500 [Thermodesulfobacteriota bacterium]
MGGKKRSFLRGSSKIGFMRRKALPDSFRQPFIVSTGTLAASNHASQAEHHRSRAKKLSCKLRFLMLKIAFTILHAFRRP